MKTLSIIVACDNEGGIGKNKKIPWLNEDWSKEDLKRFQEITKDSIIIMGRNTYNEIVGLRGIQKNILPNRKSYVLTTNMKNLCPGAITMDSIKKIISLEPNNDIFVIGGVSLFAEALQYCDNIYMTYIDRSYGCDDFFPIKPNELLYYGFTPIQKELFGDVMFYKYIAHK